LNKVSPLEREMTMTPHLPLLPVRLSTERNWASSASAPTSSLCGP
jgi:hypothetical protein